MIFIDRHTFVLFLSIHTPYVMLIVQKTRTDLYERFVVVNDLLLHLLDVIDSFVECQQLVGDLILLYTKDKIMCYPDSRGKCGGPSCNAGKE